MKIEDYLKETPLVNTPLEEGEFITASRQISEGETFWLLIQNEKDEVIDYFEFTYGQTHTEIFNIIETKYKNIR